MHLYPAAHVVQFACATSPMLAPYVPAAQGVGAGEAVGQKDPLGQGVHRREVLRPLDAPYVPAGQALPKKTTAAKLGTVCETLTV